MQMCAREDLGVARTVDSIAAGFRKQKERFATTLSPSPNRHKNFRHRHGIPLRPVMIGKKVDTDRWEIGKGPSELANDRV